MTEHTVSRNAVERKMVELNFVWLTACEDENKRVFIWRTPADSVRLVQAFFALQEAGQSDFSLPDMFVTAAEPYDTAYNYASTLAGMFSERAGLTELPEPRWPASSQLPCWHPQDLQRLLDDFARHHSDQLRYLVMHLQPSSVASETSFAGFVAALCTVPGDSRVRFALRDTKENPVWQWLAEHYPEQTRVISIDIHEDELARQILNETPTTDGGSLLRLRQLMTDTFLALRAGSTEQTIQTGQKALDIAVQQGIPEQQVVMLSLMAGAWIQTGEMHKAIDCYVQARSAAELSAPDAMHHLVTQSLMAEGNAWYMAKDALQASERYALSAQRARLIPSPTLEMEGFRMAGFSLLGERGQLPVVAEYYFSSLMAALSMNDEERASSNMMQIFRDLLNWLAPGRTSRCNQLAGGYRFEQKRLMQQAEQQIATADQRNISEKVACCDSELVRSMERLFERIINQREEILASSGHRYRTLLSLARFYSHPFWCPGTDIAHPAEQPVSRWGCSALIPVPQQPLESKQIQVIFQQILTGSEEASDAEI